MRESRGVKGRNTAARWTLAVAALVSSLSVARPAAAKDLGDCERALPAGSVVQDVDTFRVDTGNYYQADFGDDMHLWGAPRGNAVVCWQQGRSRVAVIGKLFSDPRDGSPTCAKIAVDAFDRDGRLVAGSSSSVCSNYDTWMDRGLQAREIFHVWSSTNLDRVRVRLFHYTVGSAGDELAYTGTRRYGD